MRWREPCYLWRTVVKGGPVRKENQELLYFQKAVPQAHGGSRAGVAGSQSSPTYSPGWQEPN